MTRRQPPEISDGRLRLRVPTDADVAAIAAACRDPEIARWTKVPSPYSEDHAREWTVRVADAWGRGRSAELLITYPQTDELLGAVAVTPAPHDAAVGEVGYWVRREARRRGVATAATRLLVRWAFEHHRFRRIQLFADVENVPSQRVAERAGFSREGVLRSYVELHGRRRDYVVFAILPTDVVASTSADGE